MFPGICPVSFLSEYLISFPPSFYLGRNLIRQRVSIGHRRAFDRALINSIACCPPRCPAYVGPCFLVFDESCSSPRSTEEWWVSPQASWSEDSLRGILQAAGTPAISWAGLGGGTVRRTLVFILVSFLFMFLISFPPSFRHGRNSQSYPSMRRSPSFFVVRPAETVRRPFIFISFLF